MRFVSAKQMVNDAMNGGYAIPALNANGATYDIARAALEAAQAMNSPLILQAYESNLEYFNELTDSMEHLWHAWRIQREIKNRIKADIMEIIAAVGSEGKAL
ncbi:MAG: class II fructose-bisphosphate aldolase [Lentisphaerae bacterium]|nr:class II fructose-bisphosphate aldolase [Lentisphaerota bacterium]